MMLARRCQESEISPMSNKYSKELVFIQAVMTLDAIPSGDCGSCKHPSQESLCSLTYYGAFAEIANIQGAQEKERAVDMVWQRVARQQTQGTFHKTLDAVTCNRCLQTFVEQGIGIPYDRFILLAVPQFLITPTPTIVQITRFVPGAGNTFQHSLISPSLNMTLKQILDQARGLGFGDGNTMRFSL